jgi:CIC family chloride channel protein
VHRKKTITNNYFKLIFASILVGLASALLAYSLKHLTEFFEHHIFNRINAIDPLLFILLPTLGITAIYFLRKHAFHNRKNKGITEVYKTLDQRKDHLSFFKIPSHYINGFLTVMFGGSTGVEVSTVVATATVGNVVYEREFSARTYKRELVCAGVTAGVAVLFTSPLAGVLFAMEVIARKMRKSLVVACLASAVAAGLFIYLFDNKPLFPYYAESWTWKALPFFIVLSLFGGVLSVYFTFLVTRMKALFGKISNNFLRVNLGAIIVGTLIFFFPTLYGDSYHGLGEALQNPQHISILVLLCIAVFKPLAASLTLGAGGDGGVFAPSIVGGAFLGLMFASLCNHHFDTDLIPINFALVGMAATLSASIYAPFTSLILVCNILPNGFTLFFPVLVGSLIARYFAQQLLPYNVYSYDAYLTKQASA